MNTLRMSANRLFPAAILGLVAAGCLVGSPTEVEEWSGTLEDQAPDEGESTGEVTSHTLSELSTPDAEVRLVFADEATRSSFLATNPTSSLIEQIGAMELSYSVVAGEVLAGSLNDVLAENAAGSTVAVCGSTIARGLLGSGVGVAVVSTTGGGGEIDCPWFTDCAGQLCTTAWQWGQWVRVWNGRYWEYRRNNSGRTIWLRGSCKERGVFDLCLCGDYRIP